MWFSSFLDFGIDSAARFIFQWRCKSNSRLLILIQDKLSTYGCMYVLLNVLVNLPYMRNINNRTWAVDPVHESNTHIYDLSAFPDRAILQIRLAMAAGQSLSRQDILGTVLDPFCL
jgi:hypothetical protein